MPPLNDWLDHEFSPAASAIGPLVRRLAAAWKGVERACDVGDLETLSSNLSQLGTTIEKMLPAAERVLSMARGYDVGAYLDNQFDAAFREASAASEFPLDGQYPRYLVRPVHVHVQPQRSGVLVNRKFYRGLRVSHIVDIIRRERERLLRRPFNAQHFLTDLQGAYDGLVELESARSRVLLSGHDVGLRRVYQRLVPMRQWRAEYPETFFAFDVHRLLASGETQASDGRRVHFAPAKEARRNLTVLGASGREVQLGLISFRQD
ncbi:MAG: hypothetical protein HY691_07185 [Chloroflexi bacterium]|nr:hypothetical protein [Chloroflexota bacterium]